MCLGCFLHAVFHNSDKHTMSVEQGINHQKSSLEILKKRYAKGEIDWEEYERIRKVLLS